MKHILQTRLDGIIALTDQSTQQDEWFLTAPLYKFLWVKKGTIVIEVDHIKYTLHENEIVTLPPLHHIQLKEIEGEYLFFLFNSNFYCIFGHDDEVSCNGFLFYGSNEINCLHIDENEARSLQMIVDNIESEMQQNDNLQEEMMRILLKRFIIICTRIARKQRGYNEAEMDSYDLIRQFHILVDQHFKEKKKVQEYASMLCRSPKTLANLFAQYDLPSPLHIIHERVAAEAKRLLLYSNLTPKEIADILGFEETAAFSRFFKKMTGNSVSEYKKRYSGKN